MCCLGMTRMWTGAWRLMIRQKMQSLMVSPSRSRPAEASAADPLDLGPQAAELGLDVLVAAVDVLHVVDDGLSPGDEPGQDERGRGPQVGGHDLGARERGPAPDD